MKAMSDTFRTDTPFLRYAGQPAPEDANTLEGNGPMTIEGRLFHASHGYLVPCYFPPEDPDKKQTRKSRHEETENRIAIAHELATRFFDTVERGSNVKLTPEELMDLSELYKHESDPTRKQRIGIVYAGALVMRVEHLSEAILHGAKDKHLDDGPLTAQDELREHFKTLLQDKDLISCIRLRGNRPDPDEVIKEMLSEVAKAAAMYNGHMLLSVSQIHENRVMKIGAAMETMDKASALMHELLDASPHTKDMAPLKEALDDFAEKSRTRVAIRRGDAENFTVAEIEYKVSREHVDTLLKQLREKAEEKGQPEDVKTLKLVRQGRSLLDDMCYYRQSMDQSLKLYQQRVHTALGKEETPHTSVAVEGSSVAPAVDTAAVSAARG